MKGKASAKVLELIIIPLGKPKDFLAYLLAAKPATQRPATGPAAAR